MSHRRFQDSDIVGGTLLTAGGVFAAIYAYFNYELGTLNAMGPGFFPVLCGVLLALVGIGLFTAGWRRGSEKISSVDWGAAVPVALGVAVFAVVVRSFGLFPASLLLTQIVGFAGPRQNWRRRLFYGIALSLISYVVFAKLMGLQLRFVSLPG